MHRSEGPEHRVKVGLVHLNLMGTSIYFSWWGIPTTCPRTHNQLSGAVGVEGRLGEKPLHLHLRGHSPPSLRKKSIPEGTGDGEKHSWGGRLCVPRSPIASVRLGFSIALCRGCIFGTQPGEASRSFFACDLNFSHRSCRDSQRAKRSADHLQAGSHFKGNAGPWYSLQTFGKKKEKFYMIKATLVLCKVSEQNQNCSSQNIPCVFKCLLPIFPIAIMPWVQGLFYSNLCENVSSCP